MKIAVIGSKGLPAAQGGIERHCEEIYPRMVRLGHQVDLFARASYTGTPSWRSYEFRGVRVVPLPGLRVRGADALVTSALGALASVLSGYDIVHFHAVGPALFSFLPRFASAARVVVTCHGLDWQRAKWGNMSSRLLRWGERSGVQFADRLISVSRELCDYFARVYGRESVYIPNAASGLVDSDPDFRFVESLGLVPGRYVVFVGRLVPEKRPELLIDAFTALDSGGWKLAIVGGASDSDAFRQSLAAKTLGREDVVFTGQLRGGRLAEIIRGAGLFVLPSDLEGLPLAMLEAMAECVPVLASDIPVHRHLASEGRGLLFAAGNVAACRRSLQWAVRHPQALAAMARNAQRYVAIHHDWEHITQQTLDLYRGLIEAGLRPQAGGLSAPVDPIAPNVSRPGSL